MFWQVFCANIIKGLLSDKLLVAPIFTTRSDFFNIIFPITNWYHVFSSLFGFPTDIFSPSHLNFWNCSGSTLSGFLIYSDQLQVSTAHRSDESVYENLIDGQQNHIYKRMLVLCYNFAFGQITHCSQRRSILKCSQFYSSKSAYVSLLCKFSDKRAEISAWVMEGEGRGGDWGGSWDRKEQRRVWNTLIPSCGWDTRKVCNFSGVVGVGVDLQGADTLLCVSDGGGGKTSKKTLLLADSNWN